MTRSIKSFGRLPGVAGLVFLAMFITTSSLPTQSSRFSLSLDLDEAAGDQAVSSLDVLPDQPVSIQIFGREIKGATGMSARLRFDAAQVAYVGFDPGDALPNAYVVEQRDTTSIAIDVSSLSGSVTENAGLVGTVRLRTTAAFSDTEVWLVQAELRRDGRSEAGSGAVWVLLDAPSPPSPDFNGSGVVDFADGRGRQATRKWVRGGA